MKKINIGMLFGGQSSEYEVSEKSARNIFDNIDKDKYNVVLFKIKKNGTWALCENSFKEKSSVFFDITKKIFFSMDKEEIKIDIFFPVLHGQNGEDGSIQGFFRILNIPFVGCDLNTSSICMDKSIAKEILKSQKIEVKTANSILAYKNEKLEYESVVNQLGNIFFVKPCRMGSSVGISKIRNKKDYLQAVEKAFLYDSKIIIEEFINGREIECAVIEKNNKTIASIVGEIAVNDDFYSYDAKYLDGGSSSLSIPAKISEKVSKKIQSLSVDIFKTLECSGLSRVDFFLTKNEEIFFNEINTMPGFTDVSMYPKLLQASGLSYSEIIESLVDSGLKKFITDSAFKI